MLCPHCNKDCDVMLDPTTIKGGRLDKDSKAICDVCFKEIKLNSFMMQALLTNKKFYQPPQQTKNLYKCSNCLEKVEGVLKDDKVYCEKCKADLKLTSFIISAIKLIRGKGSVDTI